MFKGVFMLLTIAIVAVIEWQFYTATLASLAEAGLLTKVYANAAINGFLVLMIIWSLLATYFTDPGYVKWLIASNCVS